MDLLRTTLANRDLTRIELAWASASLGNWAFSILLALYAYRQGGTGAVALALMVRMLPSGLAAPYMSMLVDCHSRRSVLVWTSVIRAVSLAVAAAAAAAGTPLGVVLLFAAVFTIVNTAHRPAQAALMPQLARTPAELAAANVCWTAIEYTGFLLGSVLAGVLVGLICVTLRAHTPMGGPPRAMSGWPVLRTTVSEARSRPPRGGPWRPACLPPCRS